MLVTVYIKNGLKLLNCFVFCDYFLPLAQGTNNSLPTSPHHTPLDTDVPFPVFVGENAHHARHFHRQGYLGRNLSANAEGVFSRTY